MTSTPLQANFLFDSTPHKSEYILPNCYFENSGLRIPSQVTSIMDQALHVQNQYSFTVDDDEVTKPDSNSDSDSNNEMAIPSYWQSGIFRKNDKLMVQRVEEETSDYVNVKKSFVTGMRNFGKHIEVVGINKKNYGWSAMDEARLEAFRVFAAAIASRNGGDPNIKYGWYGGSREEIREILSYGFRRFENRWSSYGNGFCFSPVNNPMASARKSIADINGVRHILLCRLILGKPEQIPYGSQIGTPTSTESISGVDDLSSPTRYMIWEPYMNTVVLPMFIVSFQADSSTTGAQSLRIPRRPRPSFNVLMKHLTNHLSSSKMALINKQHDAYFKNKISRHAFIRSLRIIAGDDVLRPIMKIVLG